MKKLFQFTEDYHSKFYQHHRTKRNSQKVKSSCNGNSGMLVGSGGSSGSGDGNSSCDGNSGYVSGAIVLEVVVVVVVNLYWL